MSDPAGLVNLMDALNAASTGGIGVILYLMWRLDRRVLEIETTLKRRK